jgi:hypothetical protein
MEVEAMIRRQFTAILLTFLFILPCPAQEVIVARRRASGGGGGGAITIAQTRGGASTPLTITWTGAQTAGNFIQCVIEYDSGVTPNTITISGVTDTPSGNTYSHAFGPFAPASGDSHGTIDVWSSTAIAGAGAGSNVTSVAFAGGTPSFTQAKCYETHTTSGVISFDATASVHSTVTGVTSVTCGPTGTQANANSIVYGWTNPSVGPATANGATVPPFTDDGDGPGSFGSDYIHIIQSSATTRSATWTDSSSDWTCVLISYGSH